MSLRFPRASGLSSWVVKEAEMLEETQDDGVIIERVAALDVGKAEVVCCVRVPELVGAGGGPRRSAPGRR